MPDLHTPSIRRALRGCGRAALLAALCGCADALRPTSTAAPDVRPELVGAPFDKPSLYARNVWDMQLFGGRIYLGHGDSVDNWGPIPIWSLDPATGALRQEYTVDDEQVDLFRVLDGELYVPGHDPRDPDWSYGEFYRLEPGGWVEHRTIPHGLHNFDLAMRGGRLYAALGGEGIRGEETVLVSDDRGETWRVVTDEVRRVYAFFELGGELYGAPMLRRAANRTLLRLRGDRFEGTMVNGTALLPGIVPDSSGRMVRPTTFRGALVYVVARNTFGWVPVALAVTRDLAEVRRVELPDPGAVPYDLLVRGDSLFALAAAPAAGGGFTVEVHATADLVHWREVLRFQAPTFARSFEESGGDFFFGLGCDYDAPSPAAGQILRVRRAAFAAR
ncbi:MAG TPA: hypothetical protein VF771_04515 [Longimicrobiaceae bacterium]